MRIIQLKHQTDMWILFDAVPTAAKSMNMELNNSFLLILSILETRETGKWKNMFRIHVHKMLSTPLKHRY